MILAPGGTPSAPGWGRPSAVRRGPHRILGPLHRPDDESTRKQREGDIEFPMNGRPFLAVPEKDMKNVRKEPP
ncbi:hypothetical protein GCM10009678_85750 [Actinomadura kijaniata]|uniref:Uncharacterized protein n=1 Tax=Actinomadura namibiensis TaxID=182080 RepID=A0A7W3M0D4_ACTNM|nr:hypothetical protein [Actinomadura namibiensis]